MGRINPHLHSLVTDGLVSADGSLIPIPCPDPVCLMQRFRYKLVKALLAREKISPRLVEIMQNWVHPGFSVFQGERIDPDDHEARRRLAGYMVHPPISLERLRYRSAGQLWDPRALHGALECNRPKQLSDSIPLRLVRSFCRTV